MFLWTSVILTIALYAGVIYGDSDKRRNCYVSGIDLIYTPENLDDTINYCDYYLFEYAWFNATTHIFEYGPDVNSDYVTKLMELKKNSGKSVMLVVDAMTASNLIYHNMLSDSDKRQTCAKNIIDFTKNNGFCGFEIQMMHQAQFEWQIKDNESVDLKLLKENFLLFVQELRKEINSLNESEGLLLLMSIGTDADTTLIDQAYAVKELNEVVDFFSPYAFQLSDYYIKEKTHLVSILEDVEGVDPPPQSVSTIINHWIKCGAEANKIVLVAQLHGFAYFLKNDSENGVGAPVDSSDGLFAYYQIISRAMFNKWNIVSGKGKGGSYVVESKTWASIDLLEDVIGKANYVKEKNFRGLAILYVSYDCNPSNEEKYTCPKGYEYQVLKAVSEILG